MAEFGGSKAWSIQSSPLIYHLLLRGTGDTFAEDRVKAWWMGAGAADLKVYFSSCNAGVSTADGKGREGRTTEPFPPFSWAIPHKPLVSQGWGYQWLWPWDERWTAALLLLWPKTSNSKRLLNSPAVLWQKTTQSSPVLFNFAGILHKPQEWKGREFRPDPSCYCCALPGFLWGVHGKLTAGPLLQVGKRLSVKAAAS